MSARPRNKETASLPVDGLRLSDFDYELPPELIAQHPLADRCASRLLRVSPGKLEDLGFADIERLLVPGDLLIFNDTQVIKARLIGRKPTGGRVEAMIERIVEPTLALALVGTSHAPQPGASFIFGSARATVEGRDGEFFRLRFDRDVADALEAEGRVPLPPYIHHEPDAVDSQRYQTVYARRPGAVAAPTAGLHFTKELLDRIRAKGVQTAHVTLHVGAGTFQPVRSELLADHRMHREWYEVPTATADVANAALAEGRRIIAVGTTSLRALESAAGRDQESGAPRILGGTGDTELFITPGYRFAVVDRLVTNFHLPRSTLLMLVSAFAGVERIRAAYAHAIVQQYRFFSYGDAMWLERAP